MMGRELKKFSTDSTRYRLPSRCEKSKARLVSDELAGLGFFCPASESHRVLATC